MKNPQVFVGAGFKPALRREIDLIRPGNALGGFETRPYKTVLRCYVGGVFTLTDYSPVSSEFSEAGNFPIPDNVAVTLWVGVAFTADRQHA